MKHPSAYQAARRRYAIIHLGMMLACFGLAALGTLLLPLDAVWRVGYAVAVSPLVLLGVFLSRRWAEDRLRALEESEATEE
ncbi:MAG: hypothetical protein HYY02_04205 [Chloroflexi bacterium]|nr:hypothetical protein [Chloroflexota bacterium]